jgi:hypothetical protein
VEALSADALLTLQQLDRAPRLNIQRMRITLVGDSPLICHAWSRKAKKRCSTSR